MGALNLIAFRTRFWLHFGSTLAPFWASWALRGRFIGVKKSPQRVSPCQVASWKGFGRHLGAILEALEGILVALGGQNRSHYGVSTRLHLKNRSHYGVLAIFECQKVPKCARERDSACGIALKRERECDSDPSKGVKIGNPFSSPRTRNNFVPPSLQASKPPVASAGFAKRKQLVNPSRIIKISEWAS